MRTETKLVVRRIVAAVLLGSPAGFLLTMLATPLLWKLEAIVPLELAGHSGPQDWLLASSAIAASALAYVLLSRKQRV